MWAFGDTTVWDGLEDGFKLRGFGGMPMASVPVSLPLQRLFALRTHPPVAGCTLDKPGALFPAEFGYCPECGTALLEPTEAAPEPWIPPYGPGDGSKLIKHRLGQQSDLQAGSGEQVALPFQSAQLRFLVAKMGGKQRQLLALDPESRRIAVFNPQAKGQWHEIRSDLQATHLPDWAWTVALDHTENCLAVVDRSGLLWLKPDWNSSKLQTLHRIEGRALAGPGTLSEASGKAVDASDVICVPMRKSSATGASIDVLCWWCGTAAPGSPSQGWAEAPLPDVPHDEEFGQPMRTGKRSMCWPGRKGVLRVELSHSKEPLASWDAWKKEAGDESVTGLPELGPAWQDGRRRLLQQCKHEKKTVKGTDTSIRLHSIDAMAMQDCINMPYGEVLSSGKAAFSQLHNHWLQPDEYRDTDMEANDIRIPILQFSQQEGRPGLVLTAHIKTKPRDTRAFSAIMAGASKTSSRAGNASFQLEISDANTGPQWLAVQGTDTWETNASALTATEAVIYDNHLWVFIPDEKMQILRWPIALGATNSNG